MPGPISLTIKLGILPWSHLTRDSGITAPGLPFISSIGNLNSERAVSYATNKRYSGAVIPESRVKWLQGRIPFDRKGYRPRHTEDNPETPYRQLYT